MEKTMKIDGMMCPHCEKRVKKVLEELPEVDAAAVSHELNQAVLNLNTDIEDAILIKVVTDAGYKVTGIN